MFYDLNVQRSAGEKQLFYILETLISLGYDLAAISTEVSDDIVNENKKQKSNKKGHQDSVPIPLPVNVTVYKDLNIVVLNRLNIIINEPGNIHKISQSKILKQYDLISYLPGNSTVLKALTTISDFDILSLNPSIDSPPLNFSRKIYKQFVQNGIYMELPYAPTILDSSNRKYCIYMAHLYHSIGKSKNIILTSASNNVSLFRSPYNVMSIAFLYGLSEEQTKYSISENCHMLLLRARTRRRGRATIDVEA